MPFPKGQKWFFFLSLWMCFSFWNTHLAVTEGGTQFKCSAEAVEHALSLCGAEVVCASVYLIIRVESHSVKGKKLTAKQQNKMARSQGKKPNSFLMLPWRSLCEGAFDSLEKTRPVSTKHPQFKKSIFKFFKVTLDSLKEDVRVVDAFHCRPNKRTLSSVTAVSAVCDYVSVMFWCLHEALQIIANGSNYCLIYGNSLFLLCSI